MEVAGQLFFHLTMKALLFLSSLKNVLSVVSEGSQDSSASDIEQLDQSCSITRHHKAAVRTDRSRVRHILEARDGLLDLVGL